KERGQHRAMHLRVLPDVDRRQMKAERLDSTQEALHAEESRMLAVMSVQARADRIQIVFELPGPRVAARCVAPRGVQACGNQAEQHPVRHVDRKSTRLNSS